MDPDQRIQQFKQMSEADPENELGHFSLGKAYIDAGRFTDAIGALSRAIELKPTLSKAYQMLGEAHDRAGQRGRAVEVMTRGVAVANDQGDRMPRDAMARALKDWGAPVPEFEQAAPTTPGPATAAAAGFSCARCAAPKGQLPKPPFKGALGEKIYANVCQACWREWIAMGTKVINELGLVLSTKAGQDTYDQYMMEFLQLEGR
jgi:Fe-S cluster biosynthesis and repair protein YggX